MEVEHVQTKREITELLARAGAKPRKRLGQHFLIDGNLMRRLADEAAITPDDLVLEVGSGTGGLTDLLVARARRLVCVEIDRDMFDILSGRMVDIRATRGGTTDVTLLYTDVLASKHRLATDVDRILRGFDTPTSGRGCVKLVANLPYQIATPLVMNLLIDYPQVRRLCFTVQAEVAERITSGPNCKAYGPLSIVSQALCAVDVLAKIPPQAFWPAPAVDSVMIRMRVGELPFSNREALRQFASLVRGVFEHRRKTLRSALRYVLDEATCKRVCDQVDVSRRAESFTIDEWLGIYRASA